MEEEIKWTDEDVLKAMRVRGETNLFFFVSEICEFGYNPDEHGPRITEDQKELCDWLQDMYEHPENRPNSEWLHMVLAPRDTLKSTVLQGFALWLIVKNPNIRILFYGEVHEQAQKRLAVIQKIIMGGKTFKNVFGDLYGKPKGLPWNETLCTVATRTNMAIREATIETAGLDVTINSRHYDLIIPDDLHSEKNTQTKDQVEHVKDKVELLMPLVSKNGLVFFAGVFWNDADYHTRLVAEKNPNLFLRSAYKDEAETVPRYPFALPIKVLDSKKGFMSEDKFSCHYRMNPVSKGSQKFHKDYFPIIPAKEFAAVRTFLLIDPAGDPTATVEAKKDSDYVGMVVVSINSHLDVLVREMIMRRMDPTSAIEQAVTLFFTFLPFVIGVEKTGLGTMGHYLREEIRKRGRYAIVEDLLPGGRSKYQRVLELEPLAKRRKIFIAQEAQYQDEFFDQITKVTRSIKSKHDDLIDPLAYVVDMMRRYGVEVEPEEAEENFVPPELRGLTPESIAYWMAVRKKEEKRNGGMTNPMAEF